MNSIILDPSVIAKWFLPDEQETVAIKIKDDFAHKTVDIAAPLLLYYELNNLLKTAIKALRIVPEEGFAAYQGFLNLDIVVYSSKALFTATLEQAHLYDISSYDASYVALAEFLQIPLFTADQRLLKKVSSKFIKSLDEYK